MFLVLAGGISRFSDGKCQSEERLTTITTGNDAFKGSVKENGTCNPQQIRCKVVTSSLTDKSSDQCMEKLSCEQCSQSQYRTALIPKERRLIVELDSKKQPLEAKQSIEAGCWRWGNGSVWSRAVLAQASSLTKIS